jgi:catechol 2,3-dioxygenase
MNPEATLGPVHLTVADLDRAMEFYGGVLGLRSQGVDGARALTADGRTPLVVLHARPGAPPKPPHTTGLYHYALLLPTRADLARTLRRLADRRYPIEGASDHLVSEALYLADPDGNGLEIYADRPREAWPRRQGRLQMATEPLDVQGLLREVSGNPPWEGLAPATRVGHVHLHVADLARAEAFYRDVLGFELVLHFGASAAFLSVGGYHHHIGLNTWAGAGAPPPPEDAAGLRYFTLRLEDDREAAGVRARLARAGVAGQPHDGGLLVRDPSGNGILIEARRARGGPRSQRSDLAYFDSR